VAEIRAGEDTGRVSSAAARPVAGFAALLLLRVMECSASGRGDAARESIGRVAPARWHLQPRTGSDAAGRWQGNAAPQPGGSPPPAALTKPRPAG